MVVPCGRGSYKLTKLLLLKKANCIFFVKPLHVKIVNPMHVMMKTFQDMKAHLTSEHTEQTNSIHLKLDQTNVDKLTSRTYCTVSY